MKSVFRVIGSVSVFCAVQCVQAQNPVLVFNGASGGDWFANGAWLDEAGQAVSWTDGSVAVITNKNITLSQDAAVHGFRVALNTKYTISGAGKLTLGAGGIFTDTGGEFNIQNAGGLYLAASQEWFTTTGSMFCLDGRRAITSAPGVTLTVNNGQLRNNAGGGLTDQCTIIMVGANGRLSPAADPAALGSNKMVFEGPGSHMTAGGDTSALIGVPSVGSELLLNNGASISINAVKQYALPLLTVASPTGTVASAIVGSELSLTNAETVLLIQSGATLNLSTKLTDGPHGASAVRKTGPGALLLSGAQTFSGGFAVDAGPVTASAAGGLGNGTVTLASGVTLELSVNGTVANAITGAGAVSKTGSGTLALTGASSHTGGTVIHDGLVRVNALSAFGNGPLTLNGYTVAFMSPVTLLPSAVNTMAQDAGTLKAENGVTLTWDGDYAAAQAVRLAADPSGKVVINGNLTGSGFVKTDAGKLFISGTVGYTGEIVVENGILHIGDTSILEPGVTVKTTSSGMVQLDTLVGQDFNKITGTQNIALTDGLEVPIDTGSSPLTLPVAVNETLSVSALSGTGDLYKTGPGTLIIASAPTFSGKVFVLEGLLLTRAPLGNGLITISNGTFRVDSTTVTNPFMLAEATAVLSVTNSGSLGSGTLAVNTGVLRIDEGGTVGTRAVTLGGSGWVQVADGSGFDYGTLTIGGGTLDFVKSTVLTKAPVLTANCTFRALPGISAEVNDFVATSSKAKLIVNGGGQITFSGGGNFAYQSEIFVQGSGTEFFVVSNKVTLSWYAGLETGGKRFMIKDGGEVEVNGGSGSALHIGANQTGESIIEVGEGGTLNVINGTNVRLGYNANSIGVLRVSGGTANLVNIGNFQIGSDNNAGGRVELAGGTLRTSKLFTRHNTGFASVVFSGGTLQSDGINSPYPWIAENIPITIGNGGGTLDVAGLDAALWGTSITGPGTLTVTGGGTAHFTRPSPDWSGGVIADGCTLAASVTNAFGVGGTVTLGNDTLRILADALLPNPVHVTDSTLFIDAGLTVSTGIVLGGKVTKTGAGAWVADTLFDDVDLSIQAGQVTVAPVSDFAALQALAGNPAFWVDATATASLAMDGNGNVSRWNDRRTTDFYASRETRNAPVWTPDALNGLPVLDFGNLGQDAKANDNRMMYFKSYLSNIRTVFWVIGSKEGGGFLLGDNVSDNGKRHFHRDAGTANLYGGQPQDPLWGGSDKGPVRNGETWINMQPVDGTTTGLSGNFDLVTWRLSALDDLANNTAGAIWFASCFDAGNGRLNGGQELGEVLIYTNRLTDAERRLTGLYLSRKWFPQMAQDSFSPKSVSLDGAGAVFCNGHGTLHIASLIINATGVSVTGNPMTVGTLTVTGSGELQCDRLQTLEAGALELLSGATLTVDTDSHLALNVTGSLTLPDTASFRVTGATKPPPSLLLITAGGATANDPECEWLALQGTSPASRVVVNAQGEVWLKTAKGTIIILK